MAATNPAWTEVMDIKGNVWRESAPKNLHDNRWMWCLARMIEDLNALGIPEVSDVLGLYECRVQGTSTGDEGVNLKIPDQLEPLAPPEWGGIL